MKIGLSRCSYFWCRFRRLGLAYLMAAGLPAALPAQTSLSLPAREFFESREGWVVWTYSFETQESQASRVRQVLLNPTAQPLSIGHRPCEELAERLSVPANEVECSSSAGLLSPGDSMWAEVVTSSDAQHTSGEPHHVPVRVPFVVVTDLEDSDHAGMEAVVRSAVLQDRRFVPIRTSLAVAQLMVGHGPYLHVTVSRSSGGEYLVGSCWSESERPESTVQCGRLTPVQNGSSDVALGGALSLLVRRALEAHPNH